MFSSIGFTAFDVWLVFACALGGVIGSIAQAILTTIGHDGPPRSLEEMRIAPPEVQEVRGIWLGLRIFVGGVLGFVFALYFIGMLNSSASTFARIWALSFVVGYAAPKIWALKCDRLVAQVRAEREGA
jgi:hypothetical protein